MGLVVQGIRRGKGRMLGMEIQAPAGEEGGKPEGVGTHGYRVWEGRGVRSGRRVGGRGARRGSAGSGCALCPGAPLTLGRRQPPPSSPPTTTFSLPALLSAKAAQNPGLDFPPKPWAGFPGTWTHPLRLSSPLP